VALVHRPISWLGRLLWDLEVFGRENLPAGGHVVAANHFSFIDPVLVTVAEGRNVRYLAAAGLFDKHPAFDRLISLFGAIPTHKDRPPIRAIRIALAELAEGRPVGVFPEGRRVMNWGDAPPMRGAAWLAVRAAVPVVPVAIIGSDGTLSPRNPRFSRCTVRVRVLPPIRVEPFLGEPDPIDAIGRSWVAAVGEHLDPWTDHPSVGR
jgi:1-acyl-sn-glycerol-3-phosphate acyltransferase